MCESEREAQVRMGDRAKNSFNIEEKYIGWVQIFRDLPH